MRWGRFALTVAVLVAVVASPLLGLARVPVARATTIIYAKPSLLTAPTYINIVTTGNLATVIIAIATSSLMDASSAAIVARCDGGSAGAVSAGYTDALIGTGFFQALQFVVPFTGSTSAYHTISTAGGAYYYGSNNYYQMIIPSISYVVTLVNTSGWKAYNTRAMPPLVVSIVGPATASLNSSETYTAVASGGTGPYTYAWRNSIISDAEGTPVQGVYPPPVVGSASHIVKFGSGPACTLKVLCQVTDSNGKTVTADMAVVVGTAVYHAYTVIVGRSVLPDGLSVKVQANGSDMPSKVWSVHDIVNPPIHGFVSAYGTWQWMIPCTTEGTWQWMIPCTTEGLLTYEFYVLVDGHDLYIEGLVPPLGSTVSKDYNPDGTPTNGNPWSTERPSWGAWLDDLFRKLLQPVFDFFELIGALIGGLVAIFTLIVTGAGVVLVVMGSLLVEAFKAVGVWGSVWFTSASSYHALAGWLPGILGGSSRWFTGSQFAAGIDKYLGGLWTMIYPSSWFQFVSWCFAAWELLHILFMPHVQVRQDGPSVEVGESMNGMGRR